MATINPNSLPGLTLPIVGTDGVNVTRGGAVKAGLWSNVYDFIKGLLDSVYFTTPSLTGKAGEILVVDAVTGKLVCSGTTTAPTMVLGAGAGGTPTAVSISGDAVSGIISFTTGGTAPTAAGIIATVTFAAALGSVPVVAIEPGNAAAAALNGTTRVWSADSTTNFVLKCASGALTNTTAYVFKYRVIA